MIILEGPDGSGKTSLIKVLKTHWHGLPPDNYDAQVVHSPGPLPRDLFFHARKILKDTKPVCILDRFPYFSEPVYGRVLRPKPLMAVREFIMLKGQLQKLQPLVIYCRPPLAMLRQSSTVSGQMDGVHENYNALVEAYDREFASWIRDFRVLQYDFTGGEESLARVVYAVQDYISDSGKGEWI